MKKQLKIEEIKSLGFEVLCNFRQVCVANGLRYSLTGGTLLGAVRHQGFIPWDDDIDVMMPRPDYDRLMELGKTEELPFRLLSWENSGEDYPYPFAKACHPDTVLIEDDTRPGGVELGVYVDIFPVDGAGQSAREAKLRCMTFQVLHGLKICANWSSFRRSNLRKWYYEPARYVCYLLSRCLGRRLIDWMLFRTISACDFASSCYAGRLVGDFGSREIMPRTIFEDLTELTFEGQKFAAIRQADLFLTQLYGDYMQLPPEEKRVTHHHFVAYMRRESGSVVPEREEAIRLRGGAV